MYTDYTDEVDENGESYYSDEGGNNYDKEKIKKKLRKVKKIRYWT